MPETLKQHSHAAGTTTASRNLERRVVRSPGDGLTEASRTAPADQAVFDCPVYCGVVASADVEAASSPADDWLRLNRAWWDERAPGHAASGFYDVPGFLAGQESLRAFE